MLDSDIGFMMYCPPESQVVAESGQHWDWDAQVEDMQSSIAPKV